MRWRRSAWILTLGATSLALAVAAVASKSFAAQGSATALVAPTFTLAQANAGSEVYSQTCASCHGQNLDDGAFGPALKGVEFRSNWGGRSADALLTQIERMPPAAPGTLGAERHAQLLAYLLQQNGFSAGATSLSADPVTLKTMVLPGVSGGPSGGLSAGVRLPAYPVRTNPLEGITPVSDALIANPPPGSWLTWRRTFDAQGFSPLKQITKANVGDLRAAWTWSLPNGPNEATPLFHDGVLFVHAYGDKVQALDAATGDLLWQYSRRLPPGAGATVKRTFSIYGNRLFIPTSDVNVVALDVKTGRVVWEHMVADRTQGFGLTGGTLVAKGRVMVGTTGGARGGNFIVGLDAETGTEVWRFYSIARPDASGGNSWNGVPLDRRFGGSVWVTGSYEPALNLAFFGIAQTYDTGPYRDSIDQLGITNDLLYTDSTIAINPDNGRVAWHFQHQPNDQWDLDWAFERVLFKSTIGGIAKTLVATAGKQAIYDVLEADTGKYVSSMDLGLQDIVTSIDPKTGAKRVNPALIPGGANAGKVITVCPHAGGGKSWLPGSFNPETNVMFVPLVETCMDLTPVAAGGRGSLSTGVRWTLRPRADSDGRYGRVQAVHLETQKVVWTARQRAPQTSGVLATAGGVVFAGALDRALIAYDDATGKELWRARLNDVPNSSPISFMIDGQQYIATTVGNGGAQANSFPALVPEIKNPPDRGAALWVFALPRPSGR